jgi:hypothetical protein
MTDESTTYNIVDAARQQRLDMFACAAMQGYLSSGKVFTGYFKEAATEAYGYAEAMEAERERRIREGR